MKKTTFSVSMSCAHCQKRIETNIGNAEGVNSISVDLPSKKVEVNYNENLTNEASLQMQIEELGFDVEIL